MAEEKKKTLRMINSKIKPGFNEEEWSDTEIEEGFLGKGPLARRYIEKLDMEFISFQAEKKKGGGDHDASPISVKIPNGLLGDIAMLVESNKLPFRDRSQFVRTAIFILMNYYGTKYPHLPPLGGWTKLSRAIDKCEAEVNHGKMIQRFIGSFEKALTYVSENNSDGGFDRFLKDQVKFVEGEKDSKVKIMLVGKLKEILVNHGINPIQYFGEEEKETTP